MPPENDEFPVSISLFDAQGRLVDWNAGFAREYADAAALLAPGISAAAIRSACLLPDRALDLSWIERGGGNAPPPFNYVNNRLSLTVTQQCSANGSIVRIARAVEEAKPLGGADPACSADLADSTQPTGLSEGNELLRSSILQMSSSILARRNQEEAALRTAHAEAESARRKLSSALAFTSMVLQSSPLPIGVYAADGRCVEANDSYAELIGISRAELLQKNFHDLEIWRTTGFIENCLMALKDNRYQRCEIHVLRAMDKHLYVECRILPALINEERHLLIQFIDLTRHKQLEDELRQYAFHDMLTRLPNRRLLRDRLKQAILNSKRRGNYFAVLFLDLDEFKQLNDTYGHDAGDQLLIQVAERLQREVRESDTVVRLAGDEFVVLLEHVGADAQSGLAAANAVAEKIRASLNGSYLLGDIEYQCGASLGVAIASGDGQDPDHILSDADAAMYKEKTRRRKERR